MKNTVSDILHGKERVMATSRLGSDESVILSLFDLQAVSFANKWKASGMIQGFLLQLA